MEFENIKQAKDNFVKYLPLSSVEVKNDNYWVNYHKKPVMGEWLLFRHIKEGLISPPILGLVVGHSIWDMALVLEYVTEWRAWEHNSEVINIHVNHYYPISSDDKTVKHIQFWTDDITVLGHWQNKPRFGELRAALKNQ